MQRTDSPSLDFRTRNLDIAEYALSLARQLGDEKTIAQALFKLAAGHGQKNAYDAAERYFSECFDLLSKFTDPDSTQDTIQCGLLLRLLLHRPLSAIVKFLQTLPVALHDDFQTALVKCRLGECLQMHDQIAEALHAFQEAKDLFTRTHVRQGSRDDACVAFEGAIANLTELGVGGGYEIRKLEGYIEELKTAIALSN